VSLARFALIAGFVALAGCQSKPTAVVNIPAGKSAALRTMEQVGIAAQTCWFASKDKTFQKYSFANELNSMSGQPRFLLVPKGNFGGKPLLVVQAKGNSSRVDAFGPLLEGEHGARISSDIDRWSRGDSRCNAAA
jgi:hypothetical protein